MIKRELVEEQQWLSPSRFNRLLAIYQVLPGPEAHELCVHLGMLKGGRVAGFLAGLGFMLPGLLLMLLLSWAYARLDLTGAQTQALFLGVQVGVIALIVRAVHRIGEHALTDRWLWAMALASAAAAALGVHFWITLPVAGLGYVLLRRRRFMLAAAMLGGAALVWVLTPASGTADGGAGMLIEPASAGAWPLFLSGLKAGLLTFGGAYTAIPFVRGDAVGRGWITDGQFLDGLALAGIIPAPLIIFATFVGFQAGGLAGALAMTAGIFVPAFAFSLLFFDQLELVMEDERLHGLLEGVAAGVVGLIAFTTVELGLGVARSVPAPAYAAAIFAGCLALLYLWRSRYNLLAMIPLSALAGWIAFG